MTEFDYTVTDELGIHARPAGLLQRAAEPFSSKVTFFFNGKQADVRKIFSMMKLGVKKGGVLHVCVEGSDEEQAAKAVRDTLTQYL